MSQAHLQELRKALDRRGWQVTERLRGEEGVEGAATWELRRYDTGPALLLDFAGFGGMGEDIPLDESYACHLRGAEGDCGLYFRRINHSRQLWLSELTTFVRSLDEYA